MGRPATRVGDWTLGARIRAGRRRKRLSVVEASQAVGVSASSWYEYERNDRTPPYVVLRSIAKLLGRSVVSLLRGAE